MTNYSFHAAVYVAVICIFCTGSCVRDSGQYTLKLPEHNVATLGEGIFARVIIPAGFTVNQKVRGGPDEQQPFDFLPYPGNWAELIQPELKSLHVLILTDALAKGSTLSIEPIAVLQLDSAGVAKNILVAVPSDTLLMSVRLDGFADLITEYEPIRYILQTWFVNYRGFGAFEVVGWRDESYAQRLLSDASNQEQ